MLLAGCKPRTTSHAAAPARTVPLAPGHYTSPAWLTDGWIVFTKYPDDTVVHQQTWRVRPDGSQLAQLNLPSSPICQVITYEYPTALWDGRVGLQQTCTFNNLAGIQSTLVASDAVSGNTTALTALRVEAWG
jgi:hypothetical protein